jgi:hypothetical protein
MSEILVHDEVGVEATCEDIERVLNGRDRHLLSHLLCKVGRGREDHLIEVE